VEEHTFIVVEVADLDVSVSLDVSVWVWMVAQVVAFCL